MWGVHGYALIGVGSEYPFDYLVVYETPRSMCLTGFWLVLPVHQMWY